jgi:hypothetical protein
MAEATSLKKCGIEVITSFMRFDENPQIGSSAHTHTHTHTHTKTNRQTRQAGDSISLLSFLETRLKKE